jgi:rfaE bifunctional protein kinase chain/domain
MRVKTAIEKFKNFRVAVLGDLILDEYLFGKVERISPEAPVPVVAIESKRIHLGGAANVALNFRALGAQVSLFGVIGDDMDGKELLGLLNHYGIDGIGIVVDGERPTTKKTRVVSRGQQMIRLDRESIAPLSPSIENLLISKLEESSKNYSALVVQDYNKGVLTERIISASLDISQGKLRAVDPKFENFFLYKGVDLFKPNLREIQDATGKRVKNEEDLIELAVDVRRRVEAKWLVITRGERGSVIFGDEEAVYIPSLKREVFDVTGAGDTVISVLVLSLLSGLSIVESSLLASIAAGIEVGKFGTATVTKEELFEVIDEEWENMMGEIERRFVR